jgi:hypothetical protein
MDEFADVVRRVTEAKDLDHKGPLMWLEDNTEACCDIVKDILAMANTLGGHLVIGVAERKPDRTLDYVGLNAEQLGSFDSTKINAFVKKYADPPINTTIAKPEVDGKTYVVIRIPQFPEVPHICYRNFPKVLTCPTLYVRTDNNASAPLDNSTDLRRLIDTALTRRRDDMLTRIRGILHGDDRQEVASSLEKTYQDQLAAILENFDRQNRHKDRGYTGYEEVLSYPIHPLPELTLARLREQAQKARVTRRSTAILEYNQDDTHAVDGGLETLDTLNWNGEPRIYFWRFNTTGLFYQRQLLRNQLPGMDRSLHLYESPLYAFCVIEAVTLLYDGLIDPTDQVHIKISLVGIRDWGLHDGLRDKELLPYRSHMDRVDWAQTHPLADWRAGMTNYAIDFFLRVCDSFNVPLHGGATQGLVANARFYVNRMLEGKA